MRVENPRTEKQILEDNLWPEGIYSFEVVDAEEKVSKKGNDMIVLTLKVFNEHGHARTFKDYLVESFALKLRHCAEVCDLVEDYESGLLSDRSFVYKTGKLSLGREVGADNQERNVVRDYIVNKDAPTNDIPDDEVPF